MKVTVVGDSWAAGYDDLSGSDTGGWASRLDPSRFEVCNLGRSGSTAKQWADGGNGWLDGALARTGTDAFVVSLLGNDMRADASDGSVTYDEVLRSASALVRVLQRLAATGKRVVVMLYSSPYPGQTQADLGVCILNALVQEAARLAGIGRGDLVDSSVSLESPGRMSGTGIHPSPDGYGALALQMEGVLL